ncbi:MAG: hypothetical protein NT027_02985, partial [Proteobacteria bacterium]|nr:hypothetical protein [Pseudomonadota bacterium]
ICNSIANLFNESNGLGHATYRMTISATCLSVRRLSIHYSVFKEHHREKVRLLKTQQFLNSLTRTRRREKRVYAYVSNPSNDF